mgnify:CR=1 FL=1
MRYVLLLLLCLTGPVLRAQLTPPATPLQAELCACIGSIGQERDDRAFQGAVRLCLENAVVRHPREVLHLLERFPGRKDKAFVLGLVFGHAMQNSCGAFGPVKARLQQMTLPAPSVGKRT